MSAIPSSHSSGDVEKYDESSKEGTHDHDVTGNTSATPEDAMHMGALTEEEEVLAKKLRIKIDLLIMPLVILVSVKERPCPILKQDALNGGGVSPTRGEITCQCAHHRSLVSLGSLHLAFRTTKSSRPSIGYAKGIHSVVALHTYPMVAKARPRTRHLSS